MRRTRGPQRDLGHRRDHPRALRLHTPAGEASLRHPRQDHDRARLRAGARGHARWTGWWWRPTTSGSRTSCAGFGGEAVMTSPRHATGTDRLAEAARGLEADVVVNVQGDEPMLDPAGIDAAARALLDDPVPADGDPLPPPAPRRGDAGPVGGEGGGRRPRATRSTSRVAHPPRAPRGRLGPPRRRRGGRRPRPRAQARRALRVPARGAPALRVAPPSPLEEAEGLEQLRALHHGMRIRVVPVDGEGGVAVDTPEDLERVRALLLPEKGRPV